MDLNDRREQHWRANITEACDRVLLIVDPGHAFRSTYPAQLQATIDALNAEYDRVRTNDIEAAMKRVES